MIQCQLELKTSGAEEDVAALVYKASGFIPGQVSPGRPEGPGGPGNPTAPISP